MTLHGAIATDPRERPLAGVRILSIEQYGAGPFGSMYLSDMGAEVIKIEQPARGNTPGGDFSRQSGPHFLGPDDSAFFQTFNLGKKSLSLDIRQPEGRDIFHRLVAGADAVMNNLKGDQPAKLGLTYDHLSAVNPRIVCTHLSGFGRSGPRAAWPSYDYLLQAEAGYMALTGEPGMGPTRMGLSIVDYLSGITTAFALTAALFGAYRSGRGRDVDVSLYDVAIHQLTYPAVWYMNEGDETERRPRSGHPFAVPCEIYPTKDGHIFLMCIMPKFWEALAEIVGHPEWIADSRFATPSERRRNRAALADLLDEALSHRTTGEWMGRLAGCVPAAPILSLGQALDNPYLAESGGIQTIAHPARADGLKVLSSPIRLDGNRLPAQRAPALGADTDAILEALGVDADAREGLRTRGVI